MSRPLNRRDFLKMAAAGAAAGRSLLPANRNNLLPQQPSPLKGKRQLLRYLPQASPSYALSQDRISRSWKFARRSVKCFRKYVRM